MSIEILSKTQSERAATKEKIARSENDLKAESAVKAKIIDLLQKGKFCKCPQKFYNSIMLSHHLPMLSQYSVEEWAQMDLFKVEGFNIGFAIKRGPDFNEIVGVHNNEFGVHGLGEKILEAAIKKGGDRLDHFGHPKLNELYEKMGFVEVQRDDYNPIYDPAGEFISKYGALPVIYRVLLKK